MADSDGLKKIDVTEFREAGYLQEVNRMFLHPLGLALEARSGWRKEDIQKYLARFGVQFGEEACDHIWTFIHTAGFDKEHIGGVWDYREDEEGIAFGDGTIDVGKAERIQAIAEKRMDPRLAALGYWVQPA